MVEGMITVLGAGFAIFVLGERFSHPIQYFGIFLAIVAMILVHLGDDMFKR
jgi:drug/metabolite transporter (DMT)-like permease